MLELAIARKQTSIDFVVSIAPRMAVCYELSRERTIECK